MKYCYHIIASYYSKKELEAFLDGYLAVAEETESLLFRKLGPEYQVLEGPSTPCEENEPYTEEIDEDSLSDCVDDLP